MALRRHDISVALLAGAIAGVSLGFLRYNYQPASIFMGTVGAQFLGFSLAVLAVVGIVNVPIIHYSVSWWNSLHQAPSVMQLAKPTMPPSMLIPLLMMLFGFTVLFVALLLVRLRAEILNRERTASWIRETVTQ